jgi:transcriptional regulator with XRE-family HTH domain
MVKASEEDERKLVRRAFSMTVVALRRKAGIAQERVALESGIDRGYMGKLERGQNVPTLETVFKLLPVFRISFVQFAEHFETNLRRARRAESRPAATRPS